MKRSSKKIVINHKAKDLYSIVLDIEKYPDYIPWCKQIEIIKKNKNEILANMIVKYKFFPKQKFTSKVTFDLKKLFIKTKYVEGPLKNLCTNWNFINIKNDSCQVIFDIEFEFENFLHQQIAEIFFPLIENKMMSSFIKRADSILD